MAYHSLNELVFPLIWSPFTLPLFTLGLNVMDFFIIYKHLKHTFISEHLCYPHFLLEKLFTQWPHRCLSYGSLLRKVFLSNCPSYHCYLHPYSTTSIFSMALISRYQWDVYDNSLVHLMFPASSTVPGTKQVLNKNLSNNHNELGNSATLPSAQKRMSLKPCPTNRHTCDSASASPCFSLSGLSPSLPW